MPAQIEGARPKPRLVKYHDTMVALESSALPNSPPRPKSTYGPYLLALGKPRPNRNIALTAVSSNAKKIPLLRQHSTEPMQTLTMFACVSSRWRTFNNRRYYRGGGKDDEWSMR
ncbi:hypothetical protein BKA70DRAFT_1223233 [Coprinopsis sp. MPI-PUGE-AT-0042]|nr:hypothetical protein BKA70DRAFT_1223233 [Coprinopsis sp. MPI-PUGE-AT-0042]